MFHESYINRFRVFSRFRFTIVELEAGATHAESRITPCQQRSGVVLLRHYGCVRTGSAPPRPLAVNHTQGFGASEILDFAYA
jgi:hypothetical protein